WLGDRLARRMKQAYLLMSGVSTLIAIPLSLAALAIPSEPVYLFSFFAAEFFLFLSTRPINVVIVNVVPVTMLSMAMGVCIFAIHLLGDAVAAPLIGLLADAAGLARAVLIVPAAIALSGFIWVLTARQADRSPAMV